MEWWQDLPDRYEAVRVRMTQVGFCEREGVSHDAFVHRMFGKWPPRGQRRKQNEEAEPGTMPSVKVVEPSVAPRSAWVEAEARVEVVLRFLPGTDTEYMASLRLRLAEGDRAVGEC